MAESAAAAASPAPAGAGGLQPAGDSLTPLKSVQHSEAQLLARCTSAVEQCRADLGDLRAACKAAASHREKCAELLGAATEAVVALEDLLYDEGLDLRRERQLQQLAGKVQQALDQVGAAGRGAHTRGCARGACWSAANSAKDGTRCRRRDAAAVPAPAVNRARLTTTTTTMPAGRGGGEGVRLGDRPEQGVFENVLPGCAPEV